MVVASQRVRKYAFPSMSFDVALSTQVPSSLMKANDGATTSVCKLGRAIGGRFRSSMVLFDASFMLAEFLSWHDSLLQVAEVKELMRVTGTRWSNWKKTRGEEVGAGLGLLSIVMSNLGPKMIATDGDDEVLHLLEMVH